MNKKGVSEVISYTMLILIAVSLSVIAFAFLRLYVPKDKPECKAGVSLMIEKVECRKDSGNPSNNLFYVNLQNTGTFKVDKAYVRLGQVNRKFKYDVNSSFGKNPHPLLTGSEEGLNPGLSYRLQLDIHPIISGTTSESYILEVQPAHYTEKKSLDSLALCPPITETISCEFL